MDQPAQPLLPGCAGREGQCGQLEIRRLWSRRAVQNRLEEGRHSQARRHDHGLWMARTRRRELGTLARDYVAGWQKAVLRTSGRNRRRGKYSCGGGAMMRGFAMTAIVALA